MSMQGMRADGPVVVGVDGSPGGWDALVWAAAEAAATGCSLRVVHVIERPPLLDAWSGAGAVPDPSDGLRGAAAAIIAEGVRRAHEVVPDLAVVSRVEGDGSVPEALIGASSGSSLLVIGKREGERPWWRCGRRRIVVAIARRSDCPVAVVELRSRPGEVFAGWVLVLDESPRRDSAVMRFACTAALHRGLDVAVVPPAGPVLPCHRGAALVVLGARRPGRRRVRLPVATTRALKAARGPTVLVFA